MNKDLILKNHIEWLRGTKQASEDLASDGLDIAKSANQADFKNCMFDGVKHEWVADEVCVIEGITCDVVFDNNGLSVAVYQNDGVVGDEQWFLDLQDEYNFTISWSEFDRQMARVEAE